jgi:hypothetical protein
MKADDSIEVALFWIVCGGGILSVLGIPLRARRFHVARLCLLLVLTACYAFYEYRMPPETNIRIDLGFVLFPLIVSWLAFVISVALSTRKAE